MPSETALLKAVADALADVVPQERLSVKKLSRYSAVIFDGNNHRTVLRMYASEHSTRIGIIDIRKVECSHTISSLSEIANHADDLKTIVRKYLGN